MMWNFVRFSPNRVTDVRPMQKICHKGHFPPRARQWPGKKLPDSCNFLPGVADSSIFLQGAGDLGNFLTDVARSDRLLPT